MSAPLDVVLLEKTFALVAPRGPELVSRMFVHLFERTPSLRAMFANTDMPAHQKKVLEALVAVVRGLRKLDKLKPALRTLGSKHVPYGVAQAHYGLVARALLEALAEIAGDAWSPAAEQAWTAALNFVAVEMLSGAALSKSEPKEAKPMSHTQDTHPIHALPVAAFAVDGDGRVIAWNDNASALTGRSAREVLGQRAWKGFGPKRRETPLDEALASCEDCSDPFRFVCGDGEEVEVTFSVKTQAGDDGEAAGAIVCLLATANQDRSADRMSAAVEGVTSAIMMIDRDLVVTYANPATHQLIAKNAGQFRIAYPTFRPEALIGTCIDVFHKNPAHQRGILADPANLPHRVDIQVAALIFEINVTAIRDARGAYTGNCLEWKDVTAARGDADRAAQMFSMAEGAGACVMLCDLDRNITYANPSVKKMLMPYAAELRKKFPGFDLDKLVGTSIDQFHVDPEKQARMFRDTKSLPYKSEISVIGLEFALNLSALFDAKGRHIGNAVEWFDQNARAAYRREVQGLFDAASSGNLAHRGALDKMDATYRPMLSSINQIVEALLAPIAEVQGRLGRLAEGDLTAYVTGDYQGDHAKLKDGMNNTLDALNQILGQVRLSAEQIASGSAQVASSSQSLSAGATKQAAAVEEITASISEMTDQTRGNAESATQAAQLATEAGSLAQTGDERMRAMVRAMTEIDESSQNISKIIKVIDEIAFQTNLLALNAAVEAARAGVHGKGFAVVAEEVRNLAARSANAAKETTAMIEGSIRKVAHGSQIATETATALNRIVGSVGKVKDLVAEIAAASNEQAQGISEVDRGLRQVDQVTQQNTAGSEESASAAEELSSQAGRLRELVAHFKLRQAAEAKSTLEMTPELIAAFEAFLHSRNGGAQPTGAAPAAAQGKKAQPNGVGTKGRPATGHAIALTDDEFGRY